VASGKDSARPALDIDFTIASMLKIFSQSRAIVVYSRRTHKDYAASEPHGNIQLASTVPPN
jgi:hypothetical protein